MTNRIASLRAAGSSTLQVAPSSIAVCGTSPLASGAFWYRGSTLWSLDDILRLGTMGEEIPFQDIPGEPVSGRFEVSEGLITVTLPDGRKTTADIEESMLSPEILARVLLLQMQGETAGRNQPRFA